MTPPLRHLPLLLTAVAVPACTVGPDYVPPELDVPDAWHRELTEGLATGEADLQRWWTLLGDATLDELIERAAGNNLDLEVAYQRVLEAQALRGIAKGNRWPDVDGFGAAIANSANPGNPIFNQIFGDDIYNTYALGADAIWEIDVWGRVTRLIEAADADLAATIEGYRDVLVVLLAQVAIEYVELRTLQQRIRFAERNIDLQEGTVQLTQDRFDAGLVSELDVRQAELNLARTRSVVPDLRNRLGVTENRLAVLLGANPGELDEALGAAAPVPAVPEQVTITGPLDALRRRPDVRQAERALAAQTARIGVAEAELYPQFTLFGQVSFGSINGNVSDTLNKNSLGWQLGPQFRWNLFDGGRVQGNLDAAKARTEQALDAYRQTVLLALEEVENAVIGYTEQGRRRDLLQQSVDAAERSVELVDQLYRDGLADFQNVLDMQRSLAQQQDALAATRGLVVQNLIALYKALGGGWDPAAAAGAATDDGDTP